MPQEKAPLPPCFVQFFSHPMTLLSGTLLSLRLCGEGGGCRGAARPEDRRAPALHVLELRTSPVGPAGSSPLLCTRVTTPLLTEGTVQLQLALVRTTTASLRLPLPGDSAGAPGAPSH